MNRHALIDRAAAVAAEAHAGATRRASTVPYIAHPVCVALELAHAGFDAETVAAALLHDVVEDTALDASAIETGFGARVGALVAGCTEPERALGTWRERHCTLLANAIGGDRALRAIMASDKAHNLRSIQVLASTLGWDRAWAAIGTQAERQEPRYRALARIVADEEGAPFEALRRAITQVFGTESMATRTRAERWMGQAADIAARRASPR